MYQVLLVDDEPAVIDGLKHIIDWEHYGFTVRAHAFAAEEALALFDSSISLIVSDIRMGRMSGLDFLSHVKQRNPHVRSIVLSGYAEFEYARYGLRIGVDNYLIKPVDVADMHATLDSLRRSLDLEHEQNQEQKLSDTDVLNARVERVCLASERPDDLEYVSEQLNLGTLRDPEFALISVLHHVQETPGAGLFDTVIQGVDHCIVFHSRDFGPHILVCETQGAAFSRKKSVIVGALQDALDQNHWPKALVTVSISVRELSGLHRAYRSLLSVRDSIDCLITQETVVCASETPYTYHPIVRFILEKIRSTELAGIHLSSVAQELKVSEEHISRVFREQTGRKFTEFMTIVRMKEARRLLRDYSLHMQDISAALGYRNANYFAKVFKEHEGLTPSEYRNTGMT